MKPHMHLHIGKKITFLINYQQAYQNYEQGLMMKCYSEKMIIFTRCICGFMANLHKRDEVSVT